ncbi:MAG: hypothetical protein AAFR60_03260 [Pseudomonadota bacterium]
MQRLVQTLAAGACAAVLAMAGAVTGVQAAEMPAPTSKTASLTGGATVALPGSGAGKKEELVQLAQRRRIRRGRALRGRGFRRRRSRRGRRVGRAITGLAVLGIVGAIAASEARASRRRSRYRGRCRRLLIDCEDGFRRACRRFDRSC